MEGPPSGTRWLDNQSSQGLLLPGMEGTLPRTSFRRVRQATRLVADIRIKGPSLIHLYLIMATITLQTIQPPLLTTLAVVGPASYKVSRNVLTGIPTMLVASTAAWVGYKTFMRYFIRAGDERRARNLIQAFDSEVRLSLDELMEEERAVVGARANGERRRFRPQRARDLACALANEAYMEFGNRPRNDANLITTRKFMRDLLLDFRDLRAKDALGIIDTALYLSFLPSKALIEMNIIDGTTAFVERSGDTSGRRSWWWPVWGRRPHA